MSYFDHINESIKNVEQEIKRLQKIKARFKKEMQSFCHHRNIVRYANRPSLTVPSINQYSAYDTIKVKTKCKDCGKVLK